MGVLVLVLAVAGLFRFGYGWMAHWTYQPVEGDVLFQSLPNPIGLDVVDAIEGATDCPFSHCGVVVKKEGQWYVIEAMVPTVQEIPYRKWIARSRDRFVVYRLKESYRSLIPQWIGEMRIYLGLPYDFRYRLEDDEIYCSELPFDAWKTLTSESMGQLVKLGDLKWENYREVIQRIEGIEAIPLDREMITPRDLATAPQLELVHENGLYYRP